MPVAFHQIKQFTDCSVTTDPSGFNIQTGDQPWSFAAFLPVLSTSRRPGAVIIGLECQVRKGMIGVALVNRAHEFLGPEQVITVDDAPSILVECDRADLVRGMIFRNLYAAGCSVALVRNIEIAPSTT